MFMASSLAIGIYASSFVALTFSASIFFLVAALLFLLSFWQIRKGLAGLIALCSFFFLFGLVRAQMPDVKWIPDTLYSYALGLSDWFQHLISSTGLSTETESLISALLLGHRTGLSADTVELFRQTGASHILALSGLHLSILTGVIYYCLLRVLVTRLRYVLGITGLLFLWGYVLVTGFPVSLCRASLMMSLLIIGQMRMVGNDTAHTLAFSALLLLLFTPNMLYDVGFQLSFLAVAGLVFFYRPLLEIGLPKHHFLRWLWKFWLVSLSAQLGVFPLLLYYFHSISVLGIIFSPIYVLIVTVIIYNALFFLLLYSCGFGLCLRYMLELFVSLQHSLMSFASHLPLCHIDNVWINEGQLILLYTALVILLPVIRALRQPNYQPSGYRLAMFFRAWPYLLAIIILLFSLFLFSFFPV